MPADAFESARLRIAPLTQDAADFALYRALYCDPSVMRYIAEPVRAGRIAASFHAAWRESRAQRFPNRWSLRTRADGAAAGLLGTLQASAADTVELGVMLLPERQAQGLAAEALQAMLTRLARDGGVRCAWSRHAPDNRAMAHVLARCGFEREAGIGDAWRWRHDLNAVAPAPASG